MSESGYEELSNNAVRTPGEFTVTEMPKKVSLSNLEQQGFPFFSGKLTLKNTFNTTDKNLYLELIKKGINAAEVTLNGKKVNDFIFSFDKADLSSFIKTGENEIEITLSNSLRNLLGPHHLISGEPDLIEPQSFYEDYHPFKPGKTERHKGYCFVETGINAD